MLIKKILSYNKNITCRATIVKILKFMAVQLTKKKVTFNKLKTKTQLLIFSPHFFFTEFSNQPQLFYIISAFIINNIKSETITDFLCLIITIILNYYLIKQQITHHKLGKYIMSHCFSLILGFFVFSRFFSSFTFSL